MRAVAYCVLGVLALSPGLVALGPTTTLASRITNVSAPVQTVDRTNKGDRLTSTTVVQKTARQKAPRTSSNGPRGKLPEGCDPLVSPLAGSATAGLTGRCMS